MPPRGLSAEEKRVRLIEIFHETKDFFQLKELEKLGPKMKGIVFWSFPSQHGALMNSRVSTAAETRSSLQGQLREIQANIESEKGSRLDTAERSAALAALFSASTQLAELEKELSQYGLCDPATIEVKRRAYSLAREATIRWTAVLTLISISGVFAATTPCTATISSLSDVDAAKDCTTVNINGFTVPAGEGFTLSLATGSTVNLRWPRLKRRSYETSSYDEMLRIKISGTFENVKVVNSPAQTFSVSNPGPLIISGMNIDNSQGDLPNANSNGLPAGHNTDGFDCSTTDLTIQNSMIKNQDDCLAINKGSNIVFTGNTCSGGHGISIGSVSSDVTVSGIVFTDNTVIDNDQAFRIKMDSDATGSTVSNITYSGNTGTGLRQFGVLIDQSYPDTLGTPGTGVILSDVNFIGTTTTLEVDSGAMQVAVNCGKGACTGNWDWASLKASGGTVGESINFDGISGFTF
ncbi:hypothetical protein EW145_g6915 [Phellinidium pouzarii]|uniref:endo-polygalacturonase n=1 Tax=Phellinidium pouzarii TaxID=167371 RepID=A0A4S4KWM2_9AGAM|nr:hypothetical protein EW145_g6915 [Phellinidium pouzarii]